jgi:hypothetical protein
MIEFLEWLELRPRTYAETIEAWHSHCPRLMIWEDSLADGLVRVEPGCSRVVVTDVGRAQLGASSQSARGSGSGVNRASTAPR